MPHVIDTRRLRLVTMDAAFLRASLADDREAAGKQLGVRLPKAWLELADVFRMRLAQVEKAPQHEPWLTRVVRSKRHTRVLGVAGFHGPPGGAWLAEYGPDAVEFGYTIFAPYRRRGYAAEASEALMRWAHDQHGVQRFVLSIGPENHASAGLAAKLGFQRVGEWIHETRGLEHVYLRNLGATGSIAPRSRTKPR